jgi:hypothetical protein
MLLLAIGQENSEPFAHFHIFENASVGATPPVVARFIFLPGSY